MLQSELLLIQDQTELCCNRYYEWSLKAGFKVLLLRSTMSFLRTIDFLTYLILSYNIESVHQLRNSYPPVKRREKTQVFKLNRAERVRKKCLAINLSQEKLAMLIKEVFLLNPFLTVSLTNNFSLAYFLYNNFSSTISPNCQICFSSEERFIKWSHPTVRVMGKSARETAFESRYTVT